MEYQFDDVDAMNAAASEAFGAWGPEIEVSQEMINGFAELTGDRQWIHIDVERAKKESPFGGPIAHGFLTLALVPKLNPGDIRIVGHGNATNYGAGGLRFLAPVPAGAKIHGRTRLVGAPGAQERHARRDRARCTWSATTSRRCSTTCRSSTCPTHAA